MGIEDCLNATSDETQNDGLRWRDLYKAAILELDALKVTGLIATARAAMAQRLAQLEENRTGSLEERWEIDEAFCSLDQWKRFHRQR